MDITSEESRTPRLALAAGMIGIAIPISQFISVPIFNEGGYLAIWLTALGLYALALFYIIFFVTDSRGKWAPKTSDEIAEKARQEEHVKREIRHAHSGSQYDFISSAINNLWQCFAVILQPREGYKRATVFFLLACLSLTLFSTGISITNLRFVVPWDGW